MMWGHDIVWERKCPGCNLPLRSVLDLQVVPYTRAMRQREAEELANEEAEEQGAYELGN